jgi:hypothetical protein
VIDVKRFRDEVVENETDYDSRRPIFAIVYEAVVPLKGSLSDEQRAAIRALLPDMSRARTWRVRDAMGAGFAQDAEEAAELLSATPSLVKVIDGAMQGVRWLHEQGFEVQDLHSGNFGMATGGRAVLFDFGHNSNAYADVPTITVAANPRVHGEQRADAFKRLRSAYVRCAAALKRIDTKLGVGDIQKALGLAETDEQFRTILAEYQSRMAKISPENAARREKIMREWEDAIDEAYEMHKNPGKRRHMPHVRAVFDECFDVLTEQFPDFGELELHQDEKAGGDNGHGSERQFGYCMDGKPIRIAFATKTDDLPEANIRGLMAHEFGHALDYRYGEQLGKMLGKRLPAGVERRADAIAHAVFGKTIKYDGKDIQCVACQGSSPRPRRLGA